MLTALRQRVANTGLVGPHYDGLLGKLRLVWEHFVIRTEIVSIATRDSVFEPTGVGPPHMHLRRIANFAELEQYRDYFDASYYPGFTAKWATPFTWGETLFFGVVDDTVTAFRWVQWGAASGRFCYYGPLLENEARMLRGGALPAFRRQGMYARFNWVLLQHVFNEGIERVYIDCYRGNVAALKGQIRAGFRPVALIRVIPALGRGPFIRWRPFPEEPAGE